MWRFCVRCERCRITCLLSALMSSNLSLDIVLNKCWCCGFVSLYFVHVLGYIVRLCCFLCMGQHGPKCLDD